MRLIIDSILSYLFLINLCNRVRANTTTISPVVTQKNVVQAGDHPNPGEPLCRARQIEYRLIKLEEEAAEREALLKSELKESNRRLHDLESDSVRLVSTLGGFKTELGRLITSGHISNSRVDSDDWNFKRLDVKIQSFFRRIHGATREIRTNNEELKSLKENVKVVGNNTRKILAQYQQLLDKGFFNAGLTEVKHHITARHISSNNCPISDTDRDKDCIDVQKKGQESGIYKIYPDGHPEGLMVVCEMESHGGGWTVIQNRQDGSQNFYLGWHDYKRGFGNLGGEFWLGLDNIYNLTGNEVNELLVELVDHTLTKKYAHYGAFSIGSEMEGYPLKLLSSYEGDAGDSLTYHAGNRFSTKDMDQDGWEEGSCARSHGGGWWYKACDTSNLNGKYLGGELPESSIYKGMYWADFRGAQYSLRQARMMVRPRDNTISKENN